MVLGGESGAEGMHLAHRYDIALCANEGYRYRPRVADAGVEWWWACVESSSVRYDWYLEAYNEQMHRILNTQKILYPLRLWRPDCQHVFFRWRGWNDPFNPREFNGLVQDSDGCMFEGGSASGTVLLNGMHILAAMGVKSIDLIGCELTWKDGEPVHFYDEEVKPVPPETREMWARTAKLVATQIPVFEQAGVEVNILCDSLICRYL